MLTTDDIKKLTKSFVTKKEFKKTVATLATKAELHQVEANLQGQIIDVRLEVVKVREEMATKDNFRSVMTLLDKVLKEVLDMRQEQTFHVQSHRDIEERLDKIEAVPAVAHQIKK